MHPHHKHVMLMWFIIFINWRFMMNKKKRITALCICIFLFSGCGMQTLNTDKEDTHTPAKEEMIISARGQGELKEHFVAFEDHLTLSDAIVYGEVSDFDMVVDGSIIKTYETLHIIETLYGNLEPDTDITLRENGGYMLIKDYLNSINAEDKQWYLNGVFKNLTNEDKKTKYYTEVTEGYYFPEVGSRAVYCLKHINDLEGVYRTTGVWQGKYREIEEGILALPDESDSLSDTEKTYNSGTITYEELKEQILEAAGKLQEN